MGEEGCALDYFENSPTQHKGSAREQDLERREKELDLREEGNGKDFLLERELALKSKEEMFECKLKSLASRERIVENRERELEFEVQHNETEEKDMLDSKHVMNLLREIKQDTGILIKMSGTGEKEITNLVPQAEGHADADCNDKTGENTTFRSDQLLRTGLLMPQ